MLESLQRRGLEIHREGAQQAQALRARVEGFSYMVDLQDEAEAARAI